MIIITIEEYASMPGRLSISIAEPGGRGLIRERGNIPGHRDYAAAAAAAIGAAMRLGKNGYHIIAPEKVLEHIPDNLRAGRI